MSRDTTALSLSYESTALRPRAVRLAFVRPGNLSDFSGVDNPDPEDSVSQFEYSEAVLQLEGVCSVFDAFTVPNSFDPLHALDSWCCDTIASHSLTGVSKR